MIPMPDLMGQSSGKFSPIIYHQEAEAHDLELSERSGLSGRLCEGLCEGSQPFVGLSM